MKICWLFSPARHGRVGVLREHARERPADPPVLDRLPVGAGHVEGDVVLPVPDREADQEVDPEPDEEPDDLLDQGVEDVDAPYAAQIDHQQPGEDRKRTDRAGCVDDVLRERVRRHLLREHLR